jgi:hypothetical protein
VNEEGGGKGSTKERKKRDGYRQIKVEKVQRVKQGGKKYE